MIQTKFEQRGARASPAGRAQYCGGGRRRFCRRGPHGVDLAIGVCTPQVWITKLDFEERNRECFVKQASKQASDVTAAGWAGALIKGLT